MILLQDVVDGGASVSFLAPLAAEAASSYWAKVAADVAHGQRIVLAARRADGIVGSVQLALAGEPFRNIGTLVSQFGGDTLSPNLMKSTISSRQANDGVQWMHDLIYKYKVSPMPEGTDTWQYFLQGRVAMFTDGCWMLNGVRTLAKFRWGVAPFFTAGQKNSVWATGHVLCISRNLPKERIPNALRLIKHLNDSGLIWSTSGMVPTRHSQIESQSVKNQKDLVPFITQLDWLYFEPPSPVTIELRDRYQQTVFSSLTGLRTVDSALDRAGTQMNRVLRTYYR
jgi:ABC-type glycerol-3-phosphate transport system substrate-binding protein